jgi:hypothetical protein
MDFIPVDEVLYLKRDELMREFQSMRLVKAARLSNPGWTERVWLWVGELLVRAGERARDRVTLPRQTYLDSAARLAA